MLSVVVVVGRTTSCVLMVVARFRCCSVWLCGVVCWCSLYGFRPVSPANKPDTFFLING